MPVREPRGPFSATCPTRELLDQLADKWSMLALIAVSDGPVRFNALRREIEGVSQKVLTQTLRKLERNGLIVRTATATVPVTVAYEISPLGRSLVGTFETLRVWAIDHIGTVRQARDQFDQRASTARPPGQE